MRFAKVASALAIVVCAAVFGVIVLQEMFFSGQAPFPARAAPADGQASDADEGGCPGHERVRRRCDGSDSDRRPGSPASCVPAR